jgi:hypothetical protein
MLAQGQIVHNFRLDGGKVIHQRRRRRGRLSDGLLAPLMNNFGNGISETDCRRQPAGFERLRESIQNPNS